MTPIYIRNDNLKKIWELLDVWVEFGFGTVCLPVCNAFLPRYFSPLQTLG